MIGQIRGTLLEKQPPLLLIDVHGIGYEVDAPMSTFYQLPDIGKDISLFTHLIIREDTHQLYGFYSRDERLLFRNLLKVNGVGPRLALTILSSVTPEDFVHCVLNQDAVNLVRIPGVGKKTAERLIIEMRDRLSDWCQPANGAGLQGKEDHNRQQILQDAISALVSLGYKPHEASRIVTKIDDGKATSESLIRLALREMV